MVKWILVVLVVVAVVMWLRLAAQRGATGSDRPRASRPLETPLPMVSCAHCGLNLPRDDALVAAGRWYCCEDHRAQARR